MQITLIYSPGSDTLTEVQLYRSTSFQPGSRVIRACSDVARPFLFSNFAALTAKSQNIKKKPFQRQGRLGLTAGVISDVDKAAGEIATSFQHHFGRSRRFSRLAFRNTKLISVA